MSVHALKYERQILTAARWTALFAAVAEGHSQPVEVNLPPHRPRHDDRRRPRRFQMGGRRRFVFFAVVNQDNCRT